MTEDELVELMREEFRAQLNELHDPIDFDNAVGYAINDTGWSLPQTDDFNVLWLKRRTKRHLIDKLRIEAARKFRVENYHLDNRFKHYNIMIKDEDTAFEKAMELNPEKFDAMTITDMFGTALGAGFASNSAGQDTTYIDDNLVKVEP